MPLRLLFPGPLRITLGRDSCEIACPRDGTQGALWAVLLDRFPLLNSQHAAIRFARNGEFMLSHELLQPGDEVALIAPVSGG
jgi:molybdopterin converting factor small subunit